MQDVLDEEWRANRGMVVQFVGVNNISYDDKSRELIDMRSQTSMLVIPICVRRMYKPLWPAVLKLLVPMKGVQVMHSLVSAWA